jgi:rRNA maturation RNase YbeY
VAITSKVNFFYEVSDFSLRDRNLLKAFIEKIFRKEGRSLSSLNYIFVTDEKLLQINRDYLKHDYYTDIITFDLSSGTAITGEIYISIDRVKENALELHQTFKKELHRVMFHGALHLCGYKDKTPSDTLKMRKMEEKYLKAYFS